MNTSTARWANDRLSAWLQESAEGTALDLLEQIKEAVEHWTQCDGRDRTCAGLTDECKETASDDCKHCETDCEECQNHRVGYGSGSWATRRALDVLSDLETLLENQERSVA